MLAVSLGSRGRHRAVHSARCGSWQARTHQWSLTGHFLQRDLEPSAATPSACVPSSASSNAIPMEGPSGHKCQGSDEEAALREQLSGGGCSVQGRQGTPGTIMPAPNTASTFPRPLFPAHCPHSRLSCPSQQWSWLHHSHFKSLQSPRKTLRILLNSHSSWGCEHASASLGRE